MIEKRYHCLKCGRFLKTIVDFDIMSPDYFNSKYWFIRCMCGYTNHIKFCNHGIMHIVKLENGEEFWICAKCNQKIYKKIDGKLEDWEFN